MSREPDTEVGPGGGDYEQEDSPWTSPPVHGGRLEGISIPYSVAEGRVSEAHPGSQVLSGENPGARLKNGYDPQREDHVGPAGFKKTSAEPEWATTTQPGLPKTPGESTRPPLSSSRLAVVSTAGGESSANSPTKGGDDDVCCDPGAQGCDDYLDDEGIVGAAGWLQSTHDMLNREDPGKS